MLRKLEINEIQNRTKNQSMLNLFCRTRRKSFRARGRLTPNSEGVGSPRFLWGVGTPPPKFNVYSLHGDLET